MENFLVILNQTLTLYLIIPLLCFLGIFLSIKLKFPQIFRLKEGFVHLFRKEKKTEGSISNFQAVATVLAGNLGTGNISGMAIALAFGGPGALFWMWIMAFLGTVIKFAGCLLGFEYRKKNSEGEYVGGPMYYLSRGLKANKTAVLFSIFCIFCAFTTGNFVQVNSIALPLKQLSIHPLILSSLLIVLVGIVILGNTLFFARIAAIVVPVMALLYLGTAIYILSAYASKILPALSLIFSSAFNPSAAISGTIGFGVIHAITSGFERGVFATDAGVGIAPILQAGAREKNPINEGLVAMTAPLFVMIICSITFLVLLVTDANLSNFQSTELCAFAFKTGIGSAFGSFVIYISLFFFGVTTILAWGIAAEKAVEYLFGLSLKKYFQILFILIVPLGVFLEVHLVWKLADLAMALMLITNVIGVIGLSRHVITITRTKKTNI